VKHLTRRLLLALGIAIPLWLRQYRAEQNLEARCRTQEAELKRFSGEVVEHLDKAGKDHERWGEGLVEQINKGGRRR
jgi:hypothetical protein